MSELDCPPRLVMPTSIMLVACEVPTKTQKRTERIQDQDQIGPGGRG